MTEIVPGESFVDEPICPTCGATKKTSRIYRLNRRARPIGENWYCTFCGLCFKYRSREQEKLLAAIQEKMRG